MPRTTPALPYNSKKPKTVLLASFSVCINTDSQAKTHAHTSRWMSEILLTTTQMITAYGKPPQPHLLFAPSVTSFIIFFSFSLLSSPQFLQLIPFFQISFIFLTVFLQQFFHQPPLSSFLSSPTSVLSYLMLLSSLFLSFLQSPAEEAQIKVSAIPLPVIQCQLPFCGHFLCFALTPLLPLKTLTQYPYNPYTHTDTQISTNKVTHHLFLLSLEDMRPRIPLIFFFFLHYWCRQSKHTMYDGNIS